MRQLVATVVGIGTESTHSDCLALKALSCLPACHLVPPGLNFRDELRKFYAVANALKPLLGLNANFRSVQYHCSGPTDQMTNATQVYAWQFPTKKLNS